MQATHKNPASGGGARGKAFPRGFSLVEVLVVAGILGLLLGLLLPAIQSARESARLLQCGFNLRQIGVAIHARHEARRVLPTSVASGGFDFLGDFDPRGGTSHSWLVQILPFLGEQPLADRFNLRQGLFAGPRGDRPGPEAERLPLLVCPSDGAGGPPFAHPWLTGGRLCGRGNYAAWAGPYHGEYQHLYPAALGWRKRPRLLDVTEGLHAALMATEVRAGHHPQDARGAWAVGWNGASVLAFDMHHHDSEGSHFRHADQSLGHTQRPNIRDAAVNVDVLYACPDPVAASRAGMPCATWQGWGTWRFLSSAPRSLHRGGVQALWADGRVTFLEDGIDEILMAYLIAIGDGQAVSLAGP
jgi:prepilin-type N-terminal cleavage/methylation domain-containing protein